MRLSVADIANLPKGDVPTRCYHCGHEGELAPPGSYFPGLCVDSVACGERCAVWCGKNPVLANRAVCEDRGYHATPIESRRCITVNPDGSRMGLAEKFGNVGQNTWELWQYCPQCGEILVSMTYREGDADAFDSAQPVGGHDVS